MKKISFFQKVYKVVKKIPHGKVTTYGAIAKYLGTPSSSRTVGWAMNACHNDQSIPAHRVVNRNGVLTGKNHFLGINLMEQLLNNEGIDVKDDKIVNFKNHFWNPNN
ncbi:MAG: cysteine methyltransferase [Flavobacteriaceae bacterium]|nr:cysteine methyltransferase [Flavobacteriaceae bacterium]